MAGIAKCKDCGSSIKWIHMSDGKYRSCDPKQKVITNLGTGDDTFILTNGETVMGYEAVNVVSNTLKGFLVGYSPHEISCPAAKDIRIKK